MSLYSCSSSSSFKRSESSNSYRLLSPSSSITTVSSQFDNDVRRDLITDDEQWPSPPVEESQSKQNIVQENWRIEKNISLKDHHGCILKATMTKEQTLISDSSTRSTIIPGKHVSMKVVFHF